MQHVCDTRQRKRTEVSVETNWMHVHFINGCSELNVVTSVRSNVKVMK